MVSPTLTDINKSKLLIKIKGSSKYKLMKVKKKC